MLIAGIVGIIVYICIDLFNNSDQNSDSNDTEYTKGTNDVILDDDYNTNYEKNNSIDLDNLKADGNIKVNKNIFTINSSGDYYITGTNDAQSPYQNYNHLKLTVAIQTTFGDTLSVSLNNDAEGGNG